MAKKYTRAEWARIQSRLPEEDRVPYESSPDAPLTPLEELRSLTVKTPIDPYYVRDPITGKSPAQLEAEALVKEAKEGAIATAEALGLKIDPITGYIIPPPKSAVIDPNTMQYDVAEGPGTNVSVLKAMLVGMGFDSDILDSSTSFLMSLLKDGLDYDNAVAVFLNTKEYTTKDGKTISSPFYAQYGYLNEGLVKPKTPAELYNAVQGYKEVVSLFNLNKKFVSKDYLKNYVKNNITVAQLSERANLARLKAVNADPAYLDSLNRLGYISGAADLTDFFLDPKVGEEAMNERRATAALGAEAIKRAKQGVQFSADRFSKIASGMLGLGLTPEQAEAKAVIGFENIAESLMPTQKLAGIYDRLPGSEGEQIQKELETEEFGGLASQRRKRLREVETRAFQGSAGTTSSSLKTARFI